MRWRHPTRHGASWPEHVVADLVFPNLHHEALSLQTTYCKLETAGLFPPAYLFEVYLFVIKRGDSTYLKGTVVVGAPATLVVVRIVISFPSPL